MSEKHCEQQPQRIPDEFRDLFTKKSIAHLATIEPNGLPHVTPVWVDYDGQYILINSAKGREKDRNMSERPDVALSIVDPDNPYRYLAVQGHVVDISEEGACEHINQLSKRYTGKETYAGPTNEIRRIYRIAPSNIMTNG